MRQDVQKVVDLGLHIMPVASCVCERTSGWTHLDVQVRANLIYFLPLGGYRPPSMVLHFPRGATFSIKLLLVRLRKETNSANTYCKINERTNNFFPVCGKIICLAAFVLYSHFNFCISVYVLAKAGNTGDINSRVALLDEGSQIPSTSSNSRSTPKADS